MIELPDVADEVVLRALDECFGVRAISLEFIPHGLDSQAWAYRVEGPGGPYFLKVNRGRIPEAGAWMPEFLSQRGLRNVVAPVPARDGDFVAQSDALSMRLQPFIEGRRGIDGGLPAAAWTELGAFLHQLHALDVPPEISSRLKRETFDSRRRKRVAELNSDMEASRHPDPIAAVLQRTEALSRRVKPGEHALVPCHADVHTANTLLADDGGLFGIDWDDAMLAPKERDLMFVLADADAEDRASFTRGYGDADIDPLILSYYQHGWGVEDVGAFAEEILDSDGASTVSRANSLSWFRSLFAEGGSVATALTSAIEVLS